MKTALMNAGATFAHLLGRGPSATRAEDEPTQREDESDEDFDQRKKKWNEDKEAKPRGESDEPTQGEEPTQREDESDEDFQKRKKKWQDDKDEAAARAAPSQAAAAVPGAVEDLEGGDRSDAADMRAQGLSAARMRERARCRAIFADAAAGKNQPLAASLAFDTDLPRGQAIKVLRNGGAVVAGPRLALDRRMAAVVVPPVGAGDAPRAGAAGGPSKATLIVAAGMRRRGEKEEDIDAFVARETAKA